MEIVRNESMRKQLYAYIKEKLNSGEIRRGEAINQKEILETLGISKTPFRDCMIQLEASSPVRGSSCATGPSKS